MIGDLIALLDLIIVQIDNRFLTRANNNFIMKQDTTVACIPGIFEIVKML